MRAASLPRWIPRGVQIAVAGALLAFLWHLADGPEAARKLAAADRRWLLAALAALSLQTVLSAVRWRVTAAQFGISLTFGEALREYYISQVVNQSLPGGMVGDAARAVRTRGQAGLLAAGQSVVFERVAGQIALFLAMTGAFVATFALPGGFDWPSWLLVPVASLIFAGAALPALLGAAARLPGRAGAGVRAGWRAFVIGVAAPDVLPRQAVLSVATTCLNLAAFAACAVAVGAELPVIAILALVPLILFTMLIPFTVAGWGLREGAAAALFPVAGATATQGLAASVAFGLVFLAAVLPGLPLVLLRRRARDAVPRSG